MSAVLVAKLGTPGKAVARVYDCNGTFGVSALAQTSGGIRKREWFFGSYSFAVAFAERWLRRYDGLSDCDADEAREEHEKDGEASEDRANDHVREPEVEREAEYVFKGNLESRDCRSLEVNPRGFRWVFQFVHANLFRQPLSRIRSGVVVSSHGLPVKAAAVPKEVRA